jgi:hypothetical protein
MFAALITINFDGKQIFCAISVIRGGKRFFIEQRSLFGNAMGEISSRLAQIFQETVFSLFAVREMIRQTCQMTSKSGSCRSGVCLLKLRRSFANLVGKYSVAAESRCAIREQKRTKFHIQVSNFRFRIIIQADATVCLSRP